MKKFFISCLSLVTIFSFSLSSVSAISIKDAPILQNEEWNPKYIDENGNYDNPETGEYFHWEETETIRTRAGLVNVKEFSFEIKNWITSGNFKLKGTNARIEMYSANFVWTSGAAASCCNNHEYTVNLRRNGLSNNIAYFEAPHGNWVWDYGDGFSQSANYIVEITNLDKLPNDSVRLKGSGTVQSYSF